MDVGKKPGAQLVVQSRRRRACSQQLGRPAAAPSRRARAAPRYNQLEIHKRRHAKGPAQAAAFVPVASPCCLDRTRQTPSSSPNPTDRTPTIDIFLRDPGVRSKSPLRLVIPCVRYYGDRNQLDEQFRDYKSRCLNQNACRSILRREPLGAHFLYGGEIVCVKEEDGQRYNISKGPTDGR